MARHGLAGTLSAGTLLLVQDQRPADRTQVVDVFVEGTNAALYHKSYTDTAVQLAIPRREADLIVRSHIAVVWHNRRLCPRRRQRPLAEVP